MKNLEKFENGLSIVQLEERYEMAVDGDCTVRLEYHAGK